VRIKLGVLAVATAAFVAAGCGGSAGGNKAGSGGASIAPGNAVAYISVDSNLDSAAWTKAKALLDRFPGKAKIIASLRTSLQQEGLDWGTDVKPALGDEIDLVWLDFRNNGQNLVGVTKPRDVDKFNALLAKSSNPPVHEEINGWTVFAEDQALLDRFSKARDESGWLDSESNFYESFNSLPADSIAKAWLRGDAVQAAFDKRLQTSGAPADTTKNQIGTLDAVTAAVTPGSDAIRIASTFSGDLELGAGDYHAELPSSLPGGAILYISFNGVGSQINKLIDTYGSSVPNFDQQRAQIELVLGYPLKDVFALLDGEDAFVVYPTKTGTPTVVFAAVVSDESKAQTILNRLAALGAASGSLHIKSVQIGSVHAKEIALGNGTFAYAAVFDGRLVTTNSRAVIEQMQGSGPKLADDSAYKAAVAGSGMPDQTSGFLYSDLSEALPYAFDYAESTGSSVPQVAKDNTAPLRGLLLYGSKDGGNLMLSGFLGIQ
jgi:Protein of unknown function (DUF3352)